RTGMLFGDAALLFASSWDAPGPSRTTCPTKQFDVAGHGWLGSPTCKSNVRRDLGDLNMPESRSSADTERYDLAGLMRTLKMPRGG
ncbi:MAG: hypothetical protein ACI9MC_003491, partial [Kiritimatiellia bacterium]